MSLLVTNYFKSQLTSLSYPADEIQYSLNYCQGDGMRFTGQLYAEDINAVADRLTNGTKKAAIKRAVDKGASIEIKSNDHRYVHYNTMYVVCDDYVCEDLTDFESQSLHEFVELVEEDIKTVSRKLEGEGYKLIEAGGEVFALSGKERTYKTARFSVTIKEVGADPFDLEMICEDTYEKVWSQFISGEASYACFEVTVTTNSDNIEISSVRSPLFIILNNVTSGKVVSDKRAFCSEAIQEARNWIKGHRLAA